MEKTEILLDQSFQEPPVAPSNVRRRITPHSLLRDVGKCLCVCIAGFCWGNGEVLHIFHPMGIAYVSLFFGEGIFFWCALLAAAAGGMSASPLKTGAAFAAACAIQLTLGRDAERDALLKKAALGAFAMVLSGIFYAISQGGLYFYFAVAAVESALVVGLSLLAQRGMAVFWSASPQAISREETLGLVLLLGGLLAGLAQMQLPVFRQGILPLLLACFLAIWSWRDGMGGGAAAGVLLGFLLYICGGIDLTFFAMLALSGFLAGCLKTAGRIPLALALITAPIVFLFYAGDAAVEIPFWAGSWAAGGVAFLLLPQKWLARLWSGMQERESSKDKYIRKKEMLEERLFAFSKAFTALSGVFRQQEEAQEKKEISDLVDRIAEEACSSCGVAHYCWEEELYHTYSMTLSALSYCEGKGRVTVKQLPERFASFCAHSDSFVETVNRIYAGYRRDRLWLGRLEECRELVGQQMTAVSHILRELSGQLETNRIFLESAADLLQEECAKVGIRLKDVRVTEEQKGRGRQVKLCLRGCGCRNVCREKILPIIKRTMNCPMALHEPQECHLGEDGICTLYFHELPSFQLATAVAFQAAMENQPSGDSAGFLQTENGVALMALSDGMGQGKKAAQESRTAIELLEQFTEAGFQRELSVKMINSALLLKKGAEGYATLDICAVDLYSGRGEFIKLGAASSYIHRGGRILTITAHTLPAGILQEIQIVNNEMLLKDGDMIFLLTDGITDALGGEDRTARWLKEQLEKFPMSNPQDAADFVLREAQKERGDGERDDMMVMAGRLWKKRKGA